MNAVQTFRKTWIGGSACLKASTYIGQHIQEKCGHTFAELESNPRSQCWCGLIEYVTFF
jgi:hypothetical protein